LSKASKRLAPAPRTLPLNFFPPVRRPRIPHSPGVSDLFTDVRGKCQAEIRRTPEEKMRDAGKELERKDFP